MNVLVYDNQLAYYELLKSNFSHNCNFVLFSPEDGAKTDASFDLVMFFLYDELELPDFMRMYSKDIPVIFGIMPKGESREFSVQGNIYYLHLDKLREEIINEAEMLLEKIMA